MMTGERRARASAAGRQLLAATLPPLLAFAVQGALWSVLAPFAWLSFYPAVLLSSWLGGRTSGVVAALLSTVLVVRYFVAPAAPGELVVHVLPAAFIFLCTSYVFIRLHDRLRRSRQEAAVALVALERTNVDLRRAVDEREMFNALVASSSDFIGIATPEGKPVYLNPAGRRMIGLSPDFPVGQVQIPECYPQELRGFVTDVILKTMLERGHWSGETYFRHFQTNAAIPVSDEHFVIRDPHDGRILGSGTVTRNISEARRITDELRESEEKFRLVIDEAPIGMALVALDGRFERVNRVLCDIVGYSADELTRRTFQDITHPEDCETDTALAQKLARGEIPRYQLEKRYLRRDGSPVDVMLSASLLRDRNGAPVCYIAQIEDISERKRAESALKSSENRLGLALDAARMGTWDLDLEKDEAVRSARHAEIFGYSTPPPSWGFSTFLAHVLPEDRDLVRRARATANESDRTEFECRIQWPDASVHWIAVRGRIIRDARGRPVRMLGTVLDITERKHAEQQLKESEARFSGIIAISADAIITIDEDQRITMFNWGAEQIFGYAQEDVVGAPLELLLPERLRDVHRRHISAFSAGDVPARRMGERRTIVGRRKSGEEFPAEAAISNLAVGDKRFLTVALRDITDRKRVELEQAFLLEAGRTLAASLDYEQTLATVADLVVRDFADCCMVEIFDRNGQRQRLKIACNDPEKAKLAATFEQLPIDRTRPYLVRSVVDTKQPLVIERVTEEMLASAAQSPAHLEALRTVHPTSLMALPLLHHDELLGVLSFISSSARVYGTKDLRLAEALAERIAGAIENARLYDAAVTATRIRDEVLAFVAHDLRNPLSTITLATNVMQLAHEDPALRRQLDVIKRAGARMTRLIHDILDAARMEGGRLTVDQTVESAEQIVQEAVEAQKAIAEAAAVHLELDLGPGVSAIWADHERLLQVFENLIGNAMKATKAGGRITAGAAGRASEVLFWVADTGVGIAAEELPHVFDRMWQAQKSRRAGAGLGLQIVKGIVEAHGGRVWVNSTPGAGTTFFFTIPTPQAADMLPSHSELH